MDRAEEDGGPQSGLFEVFGNRIRSSQSPDATLDLQPVERADSDHDNNSKIGAANRQVAGENVSTKLPKRSSRFGKGKGVRIPGPSILKRSPSGEAGPSTPRNRTLHDQDTLNYTQAATSVLFSSPPSEDLDAQAESHKSAGKRKCHGEPEGTPKKRVRIDENMNTTRILSDSDEDGSSSRLFIERSHTPSHSLRSIKRARKQVADGDGDTTSSKRARYTNDDFPLGAPDNEADVSSQQLITTRSRSKASPRGVTTQFSRVNNVGRPRDSANEILQEPRPTPIVTSNRSVPALPPLSSAPATNSGQDSSRSRMSDARPARKVSQFMIRERSMAPEMSLEELIIRHLEDPTQNLGFYSTALAEPGLRDVDDGPEREDLLVAERDPNEGLEPPPYHSIEFNADQRPLSHGLGVQIQHRELLEALRLRIEDAGVDIEQGRADIRRVRDRDTGLLTTLLPGDIIGSVIACFLGVFIACVIAVYCIVYESLVATWAGLVRLL